MKKFLVATDLSVRSDRAIQRAIALAHERTGETEVLHVIDGSLPEVVLEQHQAVAQRAISEQLASLSVEREAAITTNIIRGQDYADIIKRADDWRADMIVLGAPRDPDIGSFNGTTAERIIRGSHVPVLMVRSPVVRSYQRILVAIDMSVHSRLALQKAAGLVPNGEFFLVHATHEPFTAFLSRDSIDEVVRDEQQQFRRLVEQDIRQLTERMAATAPSCLLIMKAGAASTVIREQVAALSPDLIVIGTHGRTGIANALLGSVAEDVLAQGLTDVLAVKAW